jgi:hypothetical protein
MPVLLLNEPEKIKETLVLTSTLHSNIYDKINKQQNQVRIAIYQQHNSAHDNMILFKYS